MPIVAIYILFGFSLQWVCLENFVFPTPCLCSSHHHLSIYMYMSSSEHSHTFTQSIGAKRGRTRQNWVGRSLARLDRAPDRMVRSTGRQPGSGPDQPVPGPVDRAPNRPCGWLSGRRLPLGGSSSSLSPINPTHHCRRPLHPHLFLGSSHH